MTSSLDRRIRLLMEVQTRGEEKAINLAHSLRRAQLNLASAKGIMSKDVIASERSAINLQQHEMNNLKMENSLRMINLKAIQRQNYEQKRFKMEYLGTLFAGMALQRFAFGFLRSSINVYNQQNEKINEFLRITNKVNAAWTFFRFRLIDVLTTSTAFKTMVDFIATMIDKLSSLSSDQLLLIVGGIAALGTAGTAAFIGSQVLLGLASLKIAIGGWATAESQIAGIGMMSTGMSGAISTLKDLATIGIAVGMLWDLTEFLSGEQTFKKTLENIGLWVGALGIVKGNPWMITIGLAFAFTDEITNFGDKLINGGRRIIDEFVKDAEEGASKSELLGDSLKSVFIGGPLLAAGGSLSILGNIIKSIKEEMGFLVGENELFNDSIVKTDESLVKHSLVPSMEMLSNVVYNLISPMVMLIDSTRLYITEIQREEEAHNRNIDAISREADAIERLMIVKQNYYDNYFSEQGV